MYNQILISVLLFFVSQTFAQTSTEDSLLLAIEINRNEDCYKEYYKLTNTLAKHFVKTKNHSAIYEMDTLFNWYPETKEDSLEYRKACGRHGIRLSKYLDDHYQALQYFHEAHRSVVSKKYLDKYFFEIETRIANIYSRLNDYEKAIYYHKLCIPSAQKYNPKRIPRMYSNLGDCYKWIGEEDEMSRYYDLSIQEGKKMLPHTDGLKALQASHAHWADFYLRSVHVDFSQKKFWENWNLSKKYLDLLPVNKDYLERQEVLYNLKGDFYFRIDSLSLAVDSYLHAVEVLKRSLEEQNISRDVAKIYTRIAETKLNMADADSAEYYLTLGYSWLSEFSFTGKIPPQELLRYENTYTDLLINQAKIYFNRYKRDRDISYLDSALICVDRSYEAHDVLDDLLSLRLTKYSSSSTTHEIISLGIKYCFERHLLSNDDNDINRALAYVEKVKGKVLFEHRKSQILFDELSAEDLQYVRELNSRRSDLVRAYDKNAEDLLELIAVQDSIQSIINKHQNTSDKFQITEYLNYFKGKEYYYLITDIDGLSFHRLSEIGHIDSLIKVLKVRINQKKDVEAELSQLTNELIPFELELQNLTVLPDKDLYLLPFEILKKGDDYLLESMDIVYAHKLYADQSNKINASSRFIGIAPDYHKNTLAFSRSELEKIGSHFDQPKIIESWNNMELIREDFKDFQIFHFAGHSIIDDNPYLVLKESESPALSVLTEKDIYYTPNAFDLVCLSSCKSGVGEIILGDGLKSLSNAFIAGGTQTVVYSLWDINDRSTADIMRNTYKRIDGGRRVKEALSQSKREFIQQAEPQYRHPYYWSGIVAISHVVHETNNIHQGKIWLILATVFLTLLLFIKIIRK